MSIDWRFTPETPLPILAVQTALPGSGLADVPLTATPPPVYECVCGELSRRPLPRCIECGSVMCAENCQRVDNPAWCILCGDVNYNMGYYGREQFT